VGAVEDGAVCLLEMLAKVQGTETKYTLLQCATEWKKLLGKQKGALKGDIDTCQHLIVSLILEGFIKEEFSHTPYSTNSYCVITRRGTNALQRLQNGQRGVLPSHVTQGIEALSTAADTDTFFVHEVMQESSSSSAAAGSAPTDRRATQEFKTLRQQIANEIDVYAHFILSDSQIQELIRFSRGSDPLTLDALQASSILTSRRIELHGQRILHTCSRVRSGSFSAAVVPGPFPAAAAAAAAAASSAHDAIVVDDDDEQEGGKGGKKKKRRRLVKGDEDEEGEEEGHEMNDDWGEMND